MTVGICKNVTSLGYDCMTMHAIRDDSPDNVDGLSKAMICHTFWFPETFPFYFI